MNKTEFNIALVRPKTDFLRDPLVSEPYTQEILAAVLLKAGVLNVTILDEMAHGETTYDMLSKFNAVCVSADTPSYPRARQINEMCQEIRKSGSGNIRTIVGGPHPSALPEIVLRDGWSAVGKGEGEHIIEDLIYGKQTGIGQGQRVKNLDAVPIPERNLIDTSIYGKKRGKMGKPTAVLLTSRGCPNSCIYCYKGVFGNIVYYRSIENIMTELHDIKSRGIDKIAIYDDTFTLKPQRTIELCEKMSGLGMTWTCNARVNPINDEILRRMKNAGCDKISFGLESADSDVLRFIQKGITIEQVVKALKMSRSAGIATRLYLMFGFWEDSKETVDRTLDFLYQTPPDEVQLALLVPLPGSKIYNDAIKYEIMLPDDLEQYFYAGLDGPHSFITHTKYLNSSEYLQAVEYYKKGIAEWKRWHNPF